MGNLTRNEGGNLINQPKRSVLGRIAKKILKKIFRQFDSSQALTDRISNAEKKEDLIRKWYTGYVDAPKSYAVIAFSKDRPMQLHALLSSYKTAARESADLKVLYYASSEEFLAGYKECIRLFSAEKHFEFHLQTGISTFSQNVRTILQEIEETRIAFLVDDIVFVRKFDFRDFDRFDLRRYVPSLRLGENITYSYTMSRPEILPGSLTAHQGFLEWNWYGNGIEWSYPLSLDGNIYLKSELGPLLEEMAFGSPNTLEGEMQKRIELYINRRGVSYLLPRIVNIPCNRVQTDSDNRHGTVSSAFLLERWLRGYRIAYEDLKDLEADAPHVDCAFRLVPRE